MRAGGVTVAGRIRSLKPEILDNPRTAGLSDTAFRLFIALILGSDDYGNGYGDVRRLRSQVWWRSEPATQVDGAMAELVAAGLVISYEQNGQSYVHICGWSEHQRVAHPGKPRVPGLTPYLRSPISDQRPTTIDQGRGSHENVTRPARDPHETIALPDWMPARIWEAYRDHRRKLRAPMTEHAERLALTKLERFRTDGHDAVVIVETAIERGWRGLFAPEGRSQAASEPETSAPPPVAQVMAEQAAEEARAAVRRRAKLEAACKLREGGGG